MADIAYGPASIWLHHNIKLVTQLSPVSDW